MNLYKWQKDCLRVWEENQYRGIVHVVTGAGKTVFALAAIDHLRERFPDLRVKVVVPTIPLAGQWQTALLHHAESEAWRPGFFGGGVRDERRVMIYVINSARGVLPAHMRREFALNRHVLLICDECHHCQSPQNRRIFDFLTPETRGLYACVGLSATPFGTGDDAVLTRALGPEIYRYGFDEAADGGIVSPFVLCEVSASFLAGEMETYAALTAQIGTLLQRLYGAYPRLNGLDGGRFLRAVSSIAARAGMDPEEPAAAFLLKSWERKTVSNLAAARIQCGLALLERLAPSDRVLIFCERIEQARRMRAAIRRRWGDAAAICHSEMTGEARARNLRDFRENRARVLVSCRCLDEGLDVPDANIGIVLSGASVARQRIQRLGRIIRAAPGKDTACLYYIYIRESSDDASYLPGLDRCGHFSLRYYPAEDAFSNELYEYAAGALIDRAAAHGLSDPQLRELRRCLTEGLTRADYLLPADAQEKRARDASGVRERNYWNCMKRLGRAFR